MGQLDDIEQIRSLPNDDAKFKAYIEQSRAHESHNLDQSYRILDEALALSEKIDNSYWSTKILMEFGVLYYMAGKSESAMSDLTRATTLCPKDSIRLKAQIDNNIGTVHLQLEQIDSALYYFGRSVKLYEKIDGYEGIIALLQNIGLCHYELGQTDKAIANLEESYQWIIKSGDYQHMETLTINIMLILIESGRSNEAEEYFQRLTSSKSIRQSPIVRVKILEILGYYHQSSEEYDKALQYYQQASELNNQLGLDEKEQLDIAIAEIFDLTKRHQEANSLLMPLEPELTSMKKRRFRALAENHEYLNQADSSAKYWKLYVEALIAEKEELEKVEASAVGRDVELYSKDKEIEDLEQEKLILGLENSRRRWMLAALALLCVSLLAAFIWFRKRKQLELENRSLELKEKQQKLMSLSLQMSQKNELLDDIGNRIKATSGPMSEIGSEAKKDLEITLKQAARMEEDWKLFAQYFEDLHNGFYERLKNRSTELTSHDLRMCSLLRLRLSTKEIMAILFLSQDAVKSARSRIRKKLTLQTEENLTEFLQKV